MNQKIRKELNIIKETVLETVPAEAIYLFGSHAYGIPDRDSDLDIYVVIPDTIKENPLTVGVAIRKNLRNTEMNMPMDLIIGKSSAFKRRRQEPTLQKTIAQNGVLLYEQ
jgi:predicted nucleotidyltransferase